MNSILFAACALSFVSFLKSSEERRSLSAIMKEASWTAGGSLIFLIAGFSLRAWTDLRMLEIELSIAVLLYVVSRALRMETRVFIAATGLGFCVLEYASSWNRAALGFSAAIFLYAAFGFALWSFRRRSLFYKPAPFFVGNPFLTIQAFWVSVLLGVLTLLLMR